MRSLDWSQTRLGPVETWPQSLRTSVSICLNSAFAILVWWGPDLVMLYNDAYIPVIASKHPKALGSVGKDVFPEIWHIVGPMLEGVVLHGEAVRADDLLLLLERNGYPEECYFTFSYSPIMDESGEVAGIFTPVQETTDHVIGERRLKTLAQVAELRSHEAASISQAAQMAAGLLGANDVDLPFIAIYIFEKGGSAYRTALAGNITREFAPDHLEAGTLATVLAPLLEGLSVNLATALFSAHQPVAAHWNDYVTEMIGMPLKQAGIDEQKGFLLVGINPRKRLDATYRDFLNLVADNVASCITDAEAIQQERTRLAALAEIDRAKTAFFSNVSHEFRTPLTLILGPLADAVQDPALPATTRQELAVAQRNSLRLQKLVNNLLEFSRLEAGRTDAAFQCVDLATLTRGLASGFQSVFAKAGLTLDVDVSEARLPVYVDPDLWEKIVLNLLSNAFKFTLNGGVSIRLTDLPDSVQLTVKDSGTGIPAADLSRIFERFHRVEGAQGRSYEGSGIGLALVQELVKLHGGSVAVASQENVGTNFTVVLPRRISHLPNHAGPARTPDPMATRLDSFVSEALSWIPDGSQDADAAQPYPETEAASTAGHTHGRKRVLIADDSADMRGYLTRLLKGSFEVEAVEDGQKALDSIRRSRPDLLVSDVMMPAMSGLSLLSALRTHPETATIPVILLSARAGEEAEIEGLQTGADDYLVKPFSSRELLARVASVLKIAEVRSAAEQTLRADRARLLNLLQQAPVFVALLRGPEHVYEMTNTLHQELIGHRDVIGKTVREGIPEAEEQGIITLLDKVYQTGEPFTTYGHALDMVRSPGQPPERRYLDFTYQPLSEDDGSISGIIAVGVDVTEPMKAEKELRQSEALLAQERAVLERILKGEPLHALLEALLRGTEAQSTDGMLCSIMLTDASGRRLLHGAAPSLPEAYQRAVNGISIGAGMTSRGTAASQRKTVNIHDIVNDPQWAEFRHLAALHGLQACNSTPIFSSRGQLQGTLAMYYRRPHTPSSRDRDLIERTANLAALAIERSRTDFELERFAAIVENSHDFIGSSDLEGNPQYGNPSGMKMVGIDSLEEFRSHSIMDFFIPEQRNFVENVVIPTMARDGRWAGELTFQHFKTGAAIPVFYDLFRVHHTETGKLLYFATVTRDISEQKRASEVMQEQHERFSFATTAAQIGYWSCDLPFDKLHWDNCVKEHFWLNREAEVTIETFYECIHPEDREQTHQAIEDSISSQTRYDVEYRTMNKDGDTKWIHAVGRTRYDSHGKPTHFDGITQDVTLQKLSEEALRKGEKLAAVGRMAASISHEINNPLEAVTNLLYLIRNNAGDDTLRMYAGQAEEELARVSHIVTHTLQFNRSSSKATDVTVPTLLDSALGIYQGRLGQSDIEVVRDYRDTSDIQAQDSELRQVFANFIGNALDAIKGGGKIVVRTRDAMNWKTGQTGLRVTIADTGQGMDSSTLGRLFEPFFTTKGLNGTGLGLWVSAEILHRHRATIRVKSRQAATGSGTVFSMFFPSKTVVDVNQKSSANSAELH